MYLITQLTGLVAKLVHISRLCGSFDLSLMVKIEKYLMETTKLTKNTEALLNSDLKHLYSMQEAT